MNRIRRRMTEKDRRPNAGRLLAWLGAKNYNRWNRLLELIDATYPGVFTPEWLFGGKNYGWSLRFKRSKSLCTLIPERNRMLVLMVFGKAEREKVEHIFDSLSPAAREAYTRATTYHDGTWVVLPVERRRQLKDIVKLLAVKRRPPASRHRRPV